MAANDIKLGKKGGLVTYKVGDMILAREYNPKVHNPRTEKQVQQRAKIKLLSQLAAIVRDIIAIFPSSEKSARAIFLADNWQFVEVQELTAQFNLENLRLTNGIIPLPNIRKEIVVSTIRDRVWISMAEPPAEEVRAVFYYQFHRTNDGLLSLDGYAVSEYRDFAPEHGYFPLYTRGFKLIDNQFAEEDYYVFALGMICKTDDAWDIWTNEPYEPCELLARLIKFGYLTAQDFEFTQTSCLFWARGT